MSGADEAPPPEPPLSVPHAPADFGVPDDGLEAPRPLLGGGSGSGSGGSGSGSGPDPADGAEEVMTLVEHLTELRYRILFALAAIALGCCGTLYYSNALTQMILRTAPKVQFIALTPMEVFFTQMKIGFLAALILAVPVMTWQVWAFIRPGLKSDEAKILSALGPATTVLFFTGTAFAYKIVIPTGVNYLSTFTLEGVVAQYSLEAYTSFVLYLVLAMGLIFEAPVVLIFLARLGLVTSSGLAARRKIVILGCFIVAAVLTPTPDMVTQTLVAVPMWFLFEGTLVTLRFLGW